MKEMDAASMSVLQVMAKVIVGGNSLPRMYLSPMQNSLRGVRFGVTDA